jgi:DNA polymerase-3 subunit beta
MEVSVKREDLLRGLYLVQGVVERRSPQPILAHVLLEPIEGGIALTATDMEIGIRAQIPAQTKKKVAATVSARKLYEIVREVTADEVTLRSATAGWVEVLAGRSRFRVVSLDPKEFPELPFTNGGKDTVPIKIAAGTLREMIDKTLFAVSTDETRFNLSGVYVHTADKGVLRMAATDGHRLSLVDRAIGGPELPRGVVMPRKGLVEVLKLLEASTESELTLVVGGQYVRVQTPTVSFFMRLVEGEFPDYKQVVPGASTVKAKANRDDLLGALRRISLLASDRSYGVKLQLKKGSLELSASNPDMGEASEDIEISYSGEPLTIGFNVRYLIEVLAVHASGDTIDLALTDEVGPGVVQGSQDPSFKYVLMPMRL